MIVMLVNDNFMTHTELVLPSFFTRVAEVKSHPAFTMASVESLIC